MTTSARSTPICIVKACLAAGSVPAHQWPQSGARLLWGTGRRSLRRSCAPAPPCVPNPAQAPEVLRGERATAKSDVFSMGVVLW